MKTEIAIVLTLLLGIFLNKTNAQLNVDVNTGNVGIGVGVDIIPPTNPNIIFTNAGSGTVLQVVTPTNTYSNGIATNIGTVQFNSPSGQRIIFVPTSCGSCYTPLTQPNDAGMYFSSSGGDGDHTAGLVIAPGWNGGTVGNPYGGIRIDDLGNVGIAADLPTTPLQINNDIKEINFGQIYTAATDWMSNYIGFNASRSNDGTGTWTAKTDGGSNGGSIIINDVGGSLRFVTIPGTTSELNQTFTDLDIDNISGTSTMNIKTRLYINNGGNIGIGTSTPEAQLHVYASASPNLINAMTIQVESFGNVSNAAASSFFNLVDIDAGNVKKFDIRGNGDVYTQGTIYSSGDNELSWTLANWKVKILSEAGTAWVTPTNQTSTSAGGYMGIGMTNGGWYFMESSTDKPGQTANDPIYAFAIGNNGIAYAREVIVDETSNGPWPDAVFKKDYSLKSLPELESYVIKNKHLPDVPSAKEIEKDGIALGKMNNVLLKKVEELTLYVIEQDKKVEALKKEKAEEQKINVNELYNELKDLKKQVDELKRSK